jgi:hypothetical protein
VVRKVLVDLQKEGVAYYLNKKYGLMDYAEGQELDSMKIVRLDQECVMVGVPVDGITNGQKHQ